MAIPNRFGSYFYSLYLGVPGVSGRCARGECAGQLRDRI